MRRLLEFFRYIYVCIHIHIPLQPQPRVCMCTGWSATLRRLLVFTRLYGSSPGGWTGGGVDSAGGLLCVRTCPRVQSCVQGCHPTSQRDLRHIFALQGLFFFGFFLKSAFKGVTTHLNGTFATYLHSKVFTLLYSTLHYFTQLYSTP